MTIDPVSLAISVALTAASMAVTASQSIEGPRLSDLTATVADYGTPLNYFRGTRRFEVPCFYAEPIKERKQRRKTKGGKYNEYTYFGTWATIIADQAISHVDQIFFDRHKVYDQATGENIFAIADGYELQNFVRFYLGTEDQEVDERMAATIEAEEGIGTCPAYLGVSYIFFEDVPLEKLGNRMPQVSVVASTAGTPTYPYFVLADAWTYGVNILSSADSQLLWIAGNMAFGAPYTVIELDNREVLTQGSQPAEVKAIDPFGTLWAIHDSDTIVGLDHNGSETYNSGVIIRPGGGAAWIVDLFAFDYNGTYWVGAVPVFLRSELITYSGGAVSSLSMDELTGHGWGPSFYVQDADGDIWAFGKPGGSVTTLHILNVTGGGYHQITGLAASSGDPVARYYSDSDHDQFLVYWGGDLLIIDRPTMTLIDTVPFGDSPYVPFKSVRVRDDFWYQHESTTQFAKYSARDGSLLAVFDVATWLPGSSHMAGIYDAVNNSWVGLRGDAALVWYDLDRRIPSGTTLQACVEAVADQTGMEPADYNFADLDQTLPGHSWTYGQARDAIEHLIEFFDSDIRPNGFQLEGLKRGGAVSGDQIATEWMVLPASEQRSSSRLYNIRVIGDSDLPKRLFVSYADYNADQQANSASFARNASAVDTLRELTVDMTTTALTPAQAQPNVERIMRRRWTGSVRAENKLTPREMALNPGDVRELEFDGEIIRGRLLRKAIAPNRMLSCQWERDYQEAATLFDSEGAEQEGRPPSVVWSPGVTFGTVVDIPLIADVHDQSTPFLYLAASRNNDGSWAGADFWQSDSGVSGSYAAGWDAITSINEGTLARAGSILPAALTSVMDEGSVLIIEPHGGEFELTSITQEQLENDATANIALIGSEIIQFREAEEQGDGTWHLTGLQRGMRGTEQHVATHETGETFVLFNANVKKHDVGASEIGDTDYFKVNTLGKNITSTPAVVIPFTAAAQRPLSVCHIELARNDVTGDWQIGWMRRTRIGGSALNGQDVPLGETSESYKVRIYDGADVVRTIEVTTASTTYTAAQQTTDFGSPQTSLDVEIVQMSPALGIEGFPALAAA